MSASTQVTKRLAPHHWREGDLRLSVRLARDERLEVPLWGLPSSGYGWRVERNTALVDSMHYVERLEAPDQSAVIGAEMLSIFRLWATRPGEGVLTLIYTRPWVRVAENSALCRVTLDLLITD